MRELTPDISCVILLEPADADIFSFGSIIHISCCTLQSHAASTEGDGEQGSNRILWQVPAQSGPSPSSVLPLTEAGAAHSSVQVTVRGKLHFDNLLPIVVNLCIWCTMNLIWFIHKVDTL